MQQQELAQIRQREANLTALAAIGPRKKRKMDSPVRGASAEVSNTGQIVLSYRCLLFLLFRIRVETVTSVSFLHLNCLTLQGSGLGASQPGGSSGAGSRQFMRQRITRVNLRDLLFCLENERGTGHSQLLYKGFLK